MASASKVRRAYSPDNFRDSPGSSSARPDFSRSAARVISDRFQASWSCLRISERTASSATRDDGGTYPTCAIRNRKSSVVALWSTVVFASLPLMGETTQETGNGRDASVPVEQWWYDMLEALVGREGKAFQAKDVAEAIGVKPDRISKIRHKVDSPLWIVESISDFLKIPRPFVSFPTRELAHEYGLKAATAVKAVARGQIRREVGDIETGVTAPEYAATRRRTHRLKTPEHERSAKRVQRDRGRRRRRKRLD